MISLLLNRRLVCDISNKCDGSIQCPWLTPNDEANCSSQCPSYWPIPCDCNKPGNMKCEQRGRVCYNESGMTLVVYLSKCLNSDWLDKLLRTSKKVKYCILWLQ